MSPAVVVCIYLNFFSIFLIVLAILKQIAKGSVVDRALCPPKVPDLVAKKVTSFLTIHQSITPPGFI